MSGPVLIFVTRHAPSFYNSCIKMPLDKQSHLLRSPRQISPHRQHVRCSAIATHTFAKRPWSEVFTRVVRSVQVWREKLRHKWGSEKILNEISMFDNGVQVLRACFLRKKSPSYVVGICCVGVKSRLQPLNCPRKDTFGGRHFPPFLPALRLTRF